VAPEAAAGRRFLPASARQAAQGPGPLARRLLGPRTALVLAQLGALRVLALVLVRLAGRRGWRLRQWPREHVKGSGKRKKSLMTVQETKEAPMAASRPTPHSAAGHLTTMCVDVQSGYGSMIAALGGHVIPVRRGRERLSILDAGQGGRDDRE